MNEHSYTRINERVRAVCARDKRPRQVAGARTIDASAPRVVDSWGRTREETREKQNAGWETSENRRPHYGIDYGQGTVRGATSDSRQRNRMAVHLDVIV